VRANAQGTRPRQATPAAHATPRSPQQLGEQLRRRTRVLRDLHRPLWRGPVMPLQARAAAAHARRDLTGCAGGGAELEGCGAAGRVAAARRARAQSNRCAEQRERLPSTPWRPRHGTASCSPPYSSSWPSLYSTRAHAWPCAYPLAHVAEVEGGDVVLKLMAEFVFNKSTRMALRLPPGTRCGSRRRRYCPRRRRRRRRCQHPGS